MGGLSVAEILQGIAGVAGTLQGLADNYQDSGGSASLESLLGSLDRLDKDAGDGLHLKGISYDMTLNESFAIDSAFQDDFTVVSPWGTWAREGSQDKTFPTPAQKALIDVVSQAIKPLDTKCFIDIATLMPSTNFWTESANGKKSVVDTIAQAVNACHDDAEPVIRFLIGDQGAKERKKIYESTTLGEIFWNGSKPRITHKKARLYVGYYNPNFHPRSTDDPSIKFIQSMKESAEKLFPSLSKMLDTVDLDKHIAALVKSGLPQITWNHGKVFAINGKCLYTGGTNFYTEYTTEMYRDVNRKKVSVDHTIVDHGVKLLGDAAVSAHKWADYFWQYLDNPAKTDENSICWAAKLNDNGPTWWTREGTLTESTANSPVPIVVSVAVTGTNDKVNGLPTNVKISPIEKTISLNSGKKQIRALTVGKLGDWHGNMKQLTYPVMVIDLVRDLALNIFWQVNASLGDDETGLGFRMYGLNKLLSDVSQKNVIFKQYGITPVAWASRHAMVKAIAYATNSVIICQQSIVQSQSAKLDEFRTAVKRDINGSKALGILPGNEWDGFVWPFDLLIAIAQALGTISTNTTAPEGPFKGVFIILATKKPDYQPGWEDQTSIPRFKYRLRRLMLGIPTITGGISADKIDIAITKYLHIRRVYEDNGEMYSHSKIVNVDKKLMYIGSDNAYPCYNEEFGVWTEDESSGPYYNRDWVDGFFKTYWGKCTEPKAQEEVEWFKKGARSDDMFLRESN